MSPTPALLDAALAGTRHLSADEVDALLGRPTVIVSAPRSGSNLLFELLSRQPEIWTIGGESHAIFNAFPHLRAENAELDSGSLNAGHADADTQMLMRRAFLFLLRNRQHRSLLGQPLSRLRGSLNVVEKTPRNALNIPFLCEVFPNAQFIFLHRDPRSCIASLVEAWTVGLQTGRFVTFRDLPQWDRPAWCFLLPPGWRGMIGRTLVEIAAFQWSQSNRIVLDELQSLPADRWIALSYEALVSDPATVQLQLCRFIDPAIRPVPMQNGQLPISRTTLSPPQPDKWKNLQGEIEAVLPLLEPTVGRVSALRRHHA